MLNCSWYLHKLKVLLIISFRRIASYTFYVQMLFMNWLDLTVYKSLRMHRRDLYIIAFFHSIIFHRLLSSPIHSFWQCLIIFIFSLVHMIYFFLSYHCFNVVLIIHTLHNLCRRVPVSPLYAPTAFSEVPVLSNFYA